MDELTVENCNGIEFLNWSGIQIRTNKKGYFEIAVYNEKQKVNRLYIFPEEKGIRIRDDNTDTTWRDKEVFLNYRKDKK